MIKLNFRNTLLAATIALLSAGNAYADDTSPAFGTDSKISDLALIYAGSSRRPVWTKEQLRPYVTHVYADGHEDWLFDGFLFLEFSNGDIAYQNGLKLTPANQSDWLALLDQYFAEGYKLDALDKLIGEKKQTIGEPPLRHSVVVTCVAPTKLPSGSWPYTKWGEIDGKNINFMVKSNRVKAVEWYVDQLIEKWNKAGFKNLDLAGVYWVEEGLYTNGDIVPEINDYVRSKGLRSYWIPYYTNNRQYWEGWKNVYKFDMCYIQPNYAFYDNTGNLHPYSLLTETVDAARDYGMGLELEFETQGRSNALHSVNPTLHQHINDYMDVFDEKGVFTNAGIAYYTGTQGLIHMDESTDEVDHVTIDRMASYVAARQKARRESTGITEVEADTTRLAYTDQGRIILAPDTCCHDISGRLVHCGGGSIECDPGIYIVNDRRGNSIKLCVK